MKKLSFWFYKTSTGWVAVAGLVIFILFTALVLPRQASQSPGEHVGTPDLSFFYTPQDLYGMAEAYGEQGRADYIRVRFTFDVVWPLVYTFFLVTSISWLYARAFASRSDWRWANLVPVAAALLDFGENVSTSWVMFRYPVAAPVVAALAPFFTASKWILVSGSLMLLGIGVVAALWRVAKENRV